MPILGRADQDHDAHEHASSSEAASSPAEGGDFQALMDRAMERMHGGMSIAPSGDPDRDFARMMIPHHQGAIDMALVELRFGRNERLLRLAQAIVVEQRQEIQVMQAALGKVSGTPSPEP